MGVLKMIVSGGQTGADRAALDVAIREGIPHGGWCPGGRMAEDGVIPPIYCLRETAGPSYPARTERNVRDSDGTVIFTMGELSGGSASTAFFARRHNRPWIHFELAGADPSAVAENLAAFIHRHSIQWLNVAGSRASREPEIYGSVSAVMTQLCRLHRVLAGTGEGE